MRLAASTAHAAAVPSQAASVSPLHARAVGPDRSSPCACYVRTYTVHSTQYTVVGTYRSPSRAVHTAILHAPANLPCKLRASLGGHSRDPRAALRPCRACPSAVWRFAFMHIAQILQNNMVSWPQPASTIMYIHGTWQYPTRNARSCQWRPFRDPAARPCRRCARAPSQIRLRYGAMSLSIVHCTYHVASCVAPPHHSPWSTVWPRLTIVHG
jgi:hypothetical protein